jgi:TLC domain
MMLFWDIPISFVVPALQDPLMLMHHVGMMFVSGVSIGIFSSGGHSIGSYYAPFFFGIVEFSTIFLTIVDLFHPKNEAWHTWLEGSQSPSAKFTRGLNELCRPLFALSYLSVRCVLFPYVMVTTCLPDFWKASLLRTEEEKHGVSSMTLKVVFVLSLLFTLLQLHWGSLVARQIAKALGLMPSRKSDLTKKD